MRSTSLASIGSLLVASALSAQEHHTRPTPADSSRMGTRHDGMGMMAGPLGIGMERHGSGTAWQPDASPMYALHSMAGRWELMLHGNAFLQYIDEGSRRGDAQFGSVNWFMGMASRPVEGGRLDFRAMLSAEPVTVGKCGYPDLLATGEFCNGEPLHDRQHPHDLFMELAAHYQQQVGKGVAFELYGGPVGEPALGPVAFPHRISAMPVPLATIGHHWQDATHIAFGVATAGLYGHRWKVEGSLFNGREPDEQRFDFDLARLDSYSGRVWLLPNERWALQASVGQLTQAEAPREPGEGRADVRRATASLTYHHLFGALGSWANTLVWGQNRAHGLRTNAFLVESSLHLDERNVFFGRGELTQKSGEDLAIEDQAPALANDVFTVGKLSLGYVRQFGTRGTLLPGIGAQISVNLIPSDLDPFYGSATPVGVAVFASVRPRRMRLDQMAAADASQAMPGMHAQPATPDQHAAHGQPTVPARQDTTAAPGHAGHVPAAVTGRDTAAHAGHPPMSGMTDSARMQLLDAIHLRMMADPVIRERVATDPVLQRMLQSLPQEVRGDTTDAHTGHRMSGAAADTAEARQAMEFITLLLSDPQIEARVHADPRLHQLWSDPQVQRCLETMRRLKAAGQRLPATCPAMRPAGGKHPPH